MVIRSAVAGVAGVMMMIAAGSNPASAQGSCPAGCDGAVNWTGFSIGVGVGANADLIGHNWSEIDTVIQANTNGAPAYGNSDRGAEGFFGTVAVGYDWQVRERFVLGAFADFDFGNSNHSESTSYTSGTTTGTAGWDINRNTTWTVGGRLGVLMSNTSMVYGLIGYSQTDLDVTLFDRNPGFPNNQINNSRTLQLDGLVVGAGLEHNLGNGFSLKGEYRYTTYGKQTFGVDLANAAGNRLETDHFDLNSHSFRLTVAYKFDRGSDAVEEVSYKDVAPAPAYGSRYK